MQGSPRGGRLRLADELAALEPVTAVPDFRFRTWRWVVPVVAIVLGVMHVALVAGPLGRPAAQPVAALGAFVHYTVPRPAAESWCGVLQGDEIEPPSGNWRWTGVPGGSYVSVTHPDGGTSGCELGYTRPVRAVTIVPGRESETCAAAAGYPSFDGWDMVASRQRAPFWYAYFQSANGYLARCMSDGSGAGTWIVGLMDLGPTLPAHVVAVSQAGGDALQLLADGPVIVHGRLATDVTTISADIDGVGTITLPVERGIAFNEQSRLQPVTWPASGEITYRLRALRADGSVVYTTQREPVARPER